MKKILLFLVAILNFAFAACYPDGTSNYYDCMQRETERMMQQQRQEEMMRNQEQILRQQEEMMKRRNGF